LPGDQLFWNFKTLNKNLPIDSTKKIWLYNRANPGETKYFK
jgi:hypothetical protein